MAEPSLQELSYIQADPERGTGTPAVVIDNTELLQTINNNARLKAENDWRKYNRFLDDLSNVYQNQLDTSSMEVATDDRPYLEESTKEIFSDIMNNPKAIYSPEINNKISKLRSDATESKQNRLFDWAHRQYIMQNPDLNTEENQLAISDYWKNPLGTRKPYSLNLPDIFDSVGAFEGLRDLYSQGYADTFTTPDNQFIIEEKGTEFFREPFLKGAQSLYEIGQTKRGKPIKVWVEKRFNEMSPEMQQKVGSPENLWKSLAEKFFGFDTDYKSVKDRSQKANTNYLAKDELALKWANYGLKKRELDKSDHKDMLAADGILRELSDILNKGTPVKVVGVDGITRDVIEIADPTLLSKFATIDKDGTTTNVADAIRFDPKTNQASLVYFEKGKQGLPKRGAGGGRYIIDSKPIDARTWANITTQRTFTGKDRGAVNDIVQKVITNAGGLYELSQTYNTQPKSEQTKQKSEYIETRVVNGVKWGKKSDGTIEQIK